MSMRLLLLALIGSCEAYSLTTAPRAGTIKMWHSGFAPQLGDNTWERREMLHAGAGPPTASATDGVPSSVPDMHGVGSPTFSPAGLGDNDWKRKEMLHAGATSATTSATDGCMSAYPDVHGIGPSTFRPIGIGEHSWSLITCTYAHRSHLPVLL